MLAPWVLIASTAAAGAQPPSGLVGLQEGEAAASGATESRAGSELEEDGASTIVVVTATRREQALRDTPIAVEVLTRDEIAESGARDVAELLEERPGLNIEQNFAGSSVQLQGLSSEYVLLLIDGERVTGRIDGALDLSRYRAEQIERIEIVRGPASALYGADAVGGVINIITRRAKHPWDAEVSSLFGSRMRLELDGSSGVRIGGLSTRLDAAFRRANAYDRTPADPATEGDTYDETQLSERTRWELSRTWSLDSRGSYRLRHSAGVDQNGAGLLTDRSHETHELIASLGATGRWDAGVAQLSAHYTRFDDRYGTQGRSALAELEVERTVDELARLGMQVDGDLGASHRLNVGSELLLERMDSPRVVESRSRRARLGVYLQDEWRVLSSPSLSLVPGARLDVDSSFGPYVTPRLALRVDPAAFLILRASYGWAFRAPSFKELLLRFQNQSANYFVEGNPDLRPERSRGINMAAELRLSRAVWGSLQMYRNDLSQMISTRVLSQTGLQDGPVRYGYANVSTAYSQGLDASARFRSDFGLDVELSYSFSYIFDQEQGRPLSARPRHRGTARATYRERSLGLLFTMRTSVVGPQPFYADWDGSGVETARHSPTYALIDLRASQPLWSFLSLSLGVNNLLDAGEGPLLNLLPRSLYAGVVLRTHPLK